MICQIGVLFRSPGICLKNVPYDVFKYLIRGSNITITNGVVWSIESNLMVIVFRTYLIPVRIEIQKSKHHNIYRLTMNVTKLYL